jgi:uncharacterized phage protein gp47/JayE
MAYPTLDYRQVRDGILRDILNKLPTASVGTDSDYHIRANASGSAIEGLYEHQKWISRQLFCDTADEDILVTKHAKPRGISPKAASVASGTVRFVGSVGSPIDIGCEQKANNGIAFVATASGIVGADGTVVLAAKATTAGVAGNLAAGTKLTLTAAPFGVQSTATVVSMSGGTEIETALALLARVLFDIRMPSSGGVTHDYYKWAMEVPGVTDAYVFTQRRVANGVDVVIETTGGLPSVQLIADVQAHIETKRPPGSNVLVMGPTEVPVPITAALVLSGVTLADVTPLITAALQTYFAAHHVGDIVRRVQLTNLITSFTGVIDVNLTSPAANVQPLADATHSELAVLGAVNLT